ncbi:transposase [Ideonella sp. 4Y11]|uniref:Transposase n=1 Tax=Ideonella aquatica TaxID=2824119 RepID=A0A940YJ76_9BURK|nr:transposase [Ideonella aquatica]
MRRSARRPGWDLLLDSKCDSDSLAAGALRRIGALLDIEDDLRGQPPQVRRAQRQAHAQPLGKASRHWPKALLPWNIGLQPIACGEYGKIAA